MDNSDKRTCKRILGDTGEDAVIKMMTDNGFSLICRNFEVHNVGELDCVFRKADDELLKTDIDNIFDEVIFIVNSLINQLCANPSLLAFISKNLSWGVFKTSLINPVDDVKVVSSSHGGFISIDDNSNKDDFNNTTDNNNVYICNGFKA